MYREPNCASTTVVLVPGNVWKDVMHPSNPSFSIFALLPPACADNDLWFPKMGLKSLTLYVSVILLGIRDVFMGTCEGTKVMKYRPAFRRGGCSEEEEVSIAKEGPLVY